MKKSPVIIIIFALASACADYSGLTAVDQCAHKPGCVSTLPTEAKGPSHAQAIAPSASGNVQPN